MQKIAVLCDFDGTVARDDVGNLLFEAFSENGEAAAIVERWRCGEITSRECFEREAQLARADQDALDRFLGEYKIDPYFRDFRDFARGRGIEVAILSDGFDYYIEHMLVRSGLGDIEFFSNRLQIDGDRLRVDFPWYDKLDCTECGCCKAHHLLQYRKQGYYIVYVGDGLSDRCPSETADLVFAKGELMKHCRVRGVDYVEFRNFRDVERGVVERILLGGEFQRTGDE